MRKQSIFEEINNHNDLKFTKRTKSSGWLRHWLLNDFKNLFVSLNVLTSCSHGLEGKYIRNIESAHIELDVCNRF